MNSDSEGTTLARIRTLLALERNYLAEERTILAEIRTGLALLLLGLPSSTVIVYIFSVLPLNRPLFLDVMVYVFFIIIVIIGIWLSIRSRPRLKKIRHAKEILKQRQSQILMTSNSANDLFRNLII
ncbi:hypothetical protein ACFLQ6_08470 [Thermoproteota archaeon]